MTTATHPMVSRLAGLVALDVAGADRDTCRQALTDYETLRRFLQGFESRVAARLAEVSPTPQADAAHSTGSTSREAARSQERAKGRDHSGPAGRALADELDEGRLSGAHLDTYLRVRDSLPEGLRDEFASYDDNIVDWAKAFHVDLFARRLRSLADEIIERHGVRLLDQQRRQTFVKTWIDRITGMLRISGAFDPKSGVELDARLKAKLKELFAEATPDTCPDDPIAKQDHLRALALLALTQHGPDCSGGGGRTELLVVADTTQRDDRGRPAVDWGLPVQLPHDVLGEFFARADRVSIVDLHRNGRLVDLTDRLDLGRSTRLANRAQRRLLRARYATCAVPGCEVPFPYCDIHHITWWRHGGTTDLKNLAPLCHLHHDRVHQQGWTLHLDPDGIVTVRLPNGDTINEHGCSEPTHDPTHDPPGSQPGEHLAAYASSVPVQEGIRDVIP